jgi:hypothetical protein
MKAIMLFSMIMIIGTLFGSPASAGAATGMPSPFMLPRSWLLRKMPVASVPFGRAHCETLAQIVIETFARGCRPPPNPEHEWRATARLLCRPVAVNRIVRLCQPSVPDVAHRRYATHRLQR